MGCECFRNIFGNIFKKNNSEDQIYNSSFLDEAAPVLEDDCYFNIEKAKDIIQQCLSKDNSYYSQFLDDILSFNDEDFENLFEGFIGDKNKKIEMCNRYGISNTEAFFHLTIKFENFQMFLTQWYKNKKYYPYLIDLWHEYPNMNTLKDIYDDEEKLERELANINYSEWEYSIKNKLKECISISPEVQSCKLENFINEKYPEVRSLMDCSMQYKNYLKNYYQGMDDFKSNFSFVVKGLIEDFSKEFNLNFGNNNKSGIKGSDSLKNSINLKIQNHIFNKIDEENETNDDDSFISFEKLKSIGNQLKNGDLLNDLEKLINSKFNINLNIIGGINICFGLLDLCSSCHELYKSFLEFDELNDRFKGELYRIQDRFENHKNIGSLEGKSYDDSLAIISQAIDNIKEDRNDLINLIQRIVNAINEKRHVKKKSIFKIVKNIIEVGACTAGVVMTGGALAAGLALAGAAKGVRIICHSKRLHNARKDIKSYLKTLEQAIDIEEMVELDLEHLLEKYGKIRNQYLPKDIREEY